jgi:hypothetical protein
MRASSLLLAGIGVGAILTYALFYEPTLQQEMEFDGVEDAANKAWRWGAKRRVGAGVDTFVDRAKEEFGRPTDNDDLAVEGIACG